MGETLPATGLAEEETAVNRARLARGISNVLSPPVLVAPLLLIGVWLSGTPDAWRFAALYFLVAVVIPFVDLLWLLQRGRVSDMHLAERQDRRRPFLVTIACTTVALALLVWLGAPPVFVALVTAGLLQAVLLFLITLVWQVSVHTAAVAALATLSVLIAGQQAFGMTLLVPVVGWARLRLRRHTLAQVIAGAIVGSGALLVTMRGIMW